MKNISVFENGIHMELEITDVGDVKLLQFSADPFDPDTVSKVSGTEGFRLVELNVSGYDRPLERHGNKMMASSHANLLKFKEIKDFKNRFGRKIEITTAHENAEVVSHFQFYDGISVARCWSTVANTGKNPLPLEYISSFVITGFEKEGKLSQDDKIKIMIPHNSWYREMQWQEYSLKDLGMDLAHKPEYQHSSKVAGVTNVGNWSSKEYLPMGYLENTETGSSLFWQIEHNGSWHWEIGDQEGHLYLGLYGPDELHSHWHKNLKANETFTSVPVCVGVSKSGFDKSIEELTKYRRLIRRKNDDNENLCVIFNDYMNCLWAYPTEEKELPLIDAAAKAGCEYYCIDAGWYADGTWWDEVGVWKESKKRFPHGLKKLTDYIRSKGMIPGLWIEIEVMGINCPLVKDADESWFFRRHGMPVKERSRYQLDFCNPDVRSFASKTIDRLIKEYGVGYIKMDYNIEPGTGTEINSDSFGDGLLKHERAYLKWIDGIFKKHPDLIIENCSSGGMRIDYAMLSRYSIQSTSDQDDYKKYCTIAANSPAALTPEQAAVWSYPMQQDDNEAVVFNMVSAMLLRIHQSGHLANLSETAFGLVKEGIETYKSIRENIKTSYPFWPKGLSRFGDNIVCFGLKNGKKAYLAVFRREGYENKISLPLNFNAAGVKCIYPNYNDWEYGLDGEKNFTCSLNKPYSARLFEIYF